MGLSMSWEDILAALPKEDFKRWRVMYQPRMLLDEQLQLVPLCPDVMQIALGYLGN